MKKRKVTRTAVVLYGAAAAIWTLRAVMAVAFREYEDSAGFFLSNLLCAVVWTASFVIVLLRYRSNEKEP